MLDLTNLSGVATTAISDTRFAVNPFGIKDSQGRAFEGEVLRGGHPDWEDALTELDASDPENKARRKRALKVAYSSITANGGQRRGFRTNPKAGGDRALDKLVDEAVETPADLAAKRERNLRMKEKLAAVLFVGGRYLEGAAGPVDLSVESNRLALLNYNTNPRTGMSVVCGTRFLLDGKGNPLLDESGAEIENPWFGLPMGDAIAAWLQAEAEDEEAFFQADMEEARGNSVGGLASSTVSGLPKTETVAVQSSEA